MAYSEKNSFKVIYLTENLKWKEKSTILDVHYYKQIKLYSDSQYLCLTADKHLYFIDLPACQSIQKCVKNEETINLFTNIDEINKKIQFIFTDLSKNVLYSDNQPIRVEDSYQISTSFTIKTSNLSSHKISYQYYFIDSSAICNISLIFCHKNCNTCFDEGTDEYNKCLTCDIGKYFIDNTNNCADNPLSGYFLDKENNIFRKCHSNCKECQGIANYLTHNYNCISCFEGKYLYSNGNCYSLCSQHFEIGCKKECPEGYFQLSDKTCSACEGMYYLDSTCAQSCRDLYISGNKCVSSCPDGEVADSTKKCGKCPPENPIIENGECVSNCPKGKIKNLKNICESCPKYRPYYYNNSCLDSCEEGFIVKENNGFKECVKCENFVLDNECVSSCLDNGAHQVSQTKCIKCNGILKYFYLGKCHLFCPIDTTISEQNECIPCEKGKVIYENHCLENCPNNTYQLFGTPYCVKKICGLNEVLQDGVCKKECDAHSIKSNYRECIPCTGYLYKN